MDTNPMHQLEVYKIGPEINLGGINLSFTNASLFMTISGILILSLLFFGTKKKSLIPSKMQLLAEMSYTFIAKMINDTAGSSAKSFFPFIFTLFMFVLFSNMVGMLPYSFSVTSHIIVTFVLAATVFIGVTIIGFIKHGFKYLELFVPKGVPIILNYSDNHIPKPHPISELYKDLIFLSDFVISVFSDGDEKNRI